MMILSCVALFHKATEAVYAQYVSTTQVVNFEHQLLHAPVQDLAVQCPPHIKITCDLIVEVESDESQQG